MTQTIDEPCWIQAAQRLNRLSRRDFVCFAVAATAVVATGQRADADEVNFKAIDRTEADIFTHLAQVILPVEGTQAAPWKPQELLSTLDTALLSVMEPHILAGLKAGLSQLNSAPVRTHGKPFVALDVGSSARFLDGWDTSTETSQRALAVGLKKLVQLAYWANPASWVPIGYDGPISRRAGIASLGNAAMPQG